MNNIFRKLIKWWYMAFFCHRLSGSMSDKEKQLTTTSTKSQIAKGVRRFFEKNYELRYNVLKQTEEFRRKATHRNEKATHGAEKATQWKQLTDRELRKIAIEQMEEVGVAWSIDVELYVRSAIVADYNPITHYLQSCGEWDGYDHIRAYARRVPTSWVHWEDCFHRWFLGMVAQWQQRSRDYGNSLVPLLIGRQGTHKSTFCKLILPPSLREYYIDDIKLDSAEQVERMLARMLLVNIDEYNAKTDREQAKIKRILTERDVQTRKMRSDQYVMLPRMASFVATTNDQQPLTDPTGSRRYLCCEVDDVIDTLSPVEYTQLYAQAVHELNNGAACYFSNQEEEEIEQHNQLFRTSSSAETILLAYFQPAPRDKEHFFLAADILKGLKEHVSAVDMPSMKKLTMALKTCHFPYGRVSGQRGWYARPLQQE